MLRAILAGGIVLLAVGLTLVGYTALVLGTGLAGAVALLHHWRNVAFGLGASETSVWLAIVVAAIGVAWCASYMYDTKRY